MDAKQHGMARGMKNKFYAERGSDLVSKPAHSDDLAAPGDISCCTKSRRRQPVGEALGPPAAFYLFEQLIEAANRRKPGFSHRKTFIIRSKKTIAGGFIVAGP